MDIRIVYLIVYNPSIGTIITLTCSRMIFIYIHMYFPVGVIMMENNSFLLLFLFVLTSFDSVGGGRVLFDSNHLNRPFCARYI